MNKLNVNREWAAIMGEIKSGRYNDIHLFYSNDAGFVNMTDSFGTLTRIKKGASLNEFRWACKCVRVKNRAKNPPLYEKISYTGKLPIRRTA